MSLYVAAATEEKRGVGEKRRPFTDERRGRGAHLAIDKSFAVVAGVVVCSMSRPRSTHKLAGEAVKGGTTKGSIHNGSKEGSEPRGVVCAKH